MQLEIVHLNTNDIHSCKTVSVKVSIKASNTDHFRLGVDIWHYYHSVCSTPILGGSGGMLPQENF